MKRLARIALIGIVMGIVWSMGCRSYAQELSMSSEALFEDHGSVMLLIEVETGQILGANHAATLFYGYTREEMLNMNISRINTLSAEELRKERELALQQKRNYFEFKHRLKSGAIRYVEVYSYPYSSEGGKKILFSIIHDVTAKVEAQRQATLSKWIIVSLLLLVVLILSVFLWRDRYHKQVLEKSNDRLKNLFENMQEGFALHEIICDDQGKPVDYRFLEMNPAFERITGLKAKEILGKTVKACLPTIEPYWIEKYGEVALTGMPMQYSNFVEAMGKHFSISAYSPEIGYFATVFTDITEEKAKLDQIAYLSYHDQLTGLYNRHFFEEELKRLDTERSLPLTIVMMDVNGLKLANDAFGHLAGDELLKRVAWVLKAECRTDDIVARIGGDEFVILLPATSHYEAKSIVRRVYKTMSLQKMDNLVISVSIGWDTKTDPDIPIQKIFVKAEEHMYRKKLTEGQSMRNTTIQVILNTLNAKNERERIHAEGVSKWCRHIARQLHLDEEAVKEVEVAGLMHDIGKIAINEALLNKPERLTEAEYLEIKKHPESSYQILRSVDAYTALAEHVLYHHERWDGTGYPKGLKGEEIPYYSRILCVADAFEAMTSDRPYRQRRDVVRALEELERHAGTQFDPRIVGSFVKSMQD